mmetsp:Transcript_33855/g.111976  ORF Transcript_33855/g.111976 Transcript_33855/m.111976 type:complete len:352 (-) Transcript_33855:63-1118(-)
MGARGARRRSGGAVDTRRRPAPPPPVALAAAAGRGGRGEGRRRAGRGASAQLAAAAAALASRADMVARNHWLPAARRAAARALPAAVGARPRRHPSVAGRGARGDASAHPGPPFHRRRHPRGRDAAGLPRLLLRLRKGARPARVDAQGGSRPPPARRAAEDSRGAADRDGDAPPPRPGSCLAAAAQARPRPRRREAPRRTRRRTPATIRRRRRRLGRAHPRIAAAFDERALRPAQLGPAELAAACRGRGGRVAPLLRPRAGPGAGARLGWGGPRLVVDRQLRERGERGEQHPVGGGGGGAPRRYRGCDPGAEGMRGGTRNRGEPATIAIDYKSSMPLRSESRLSAVFLITL